jgi:hypothetical protein
MYACHNGHLETVEEFFSYLKDIDTVHRALAWAAERGRSKAVARPLQYMGVDVNANVRVSTLLLLACSSLNAETIATLLKVGANPKIHSYDAGYGSRYAIEEMNCLHQVCGLGLTGRYRTFPPSEVLQNIFSQLIQAGIDVNDPGPSGATVLHGAVNSHVLT